MIGVLDRIYARTFPAVHHSLGLFLELRDVPMGEHEVRIVIYDSERKRLAAGPQFKMNAHGRLDALHVGFQTYNLPIPREGAYFIEVLFDEEPIANDLRIMAAKVPDQPPQEG